MLKAAVPATAQGNFHVATATWKTDGERARALREQATTNLSTPWWPVSMNTAGSDGSWLFTDPNATNGQQYCRAAQP